MRLWRLLRDAVFVVVASPGCRAVFAQEGKCDTRAGGRQTPAQCSRPRLCCRWGLFKSRAAVCWRSQSRCSPMTRGRNAPPCVGHRMRCVCVDTRRAPAAVRVVLGWSLSEAGSCLGQGCGSRRCRRRWSWQHRGGVALSGTERLRRCCLPVSRAAGAPRVCAVRTRLLPRKGLLRPLTRLCCFIKLCPLGATGVGVLLLHCDAASASDDPSGSCVSAGERASACPPPAPSRLQRTQRRQARMSAPFLRLVASQRNNRPSGERRQTRQHETPPQDAVHRPVPDGAISTSTASTTHRRAVQRRSAVACLSSAGCRLLRHGGRCGVTLRSNPGRVVHIALLVLAGLVCALCDARRRCVGCRVGLGTPVCAERRGGRFNGCLSPAVRHAFLRADCSVRLVCRGASSPLLCCCDLSFPGCILCIGDCRRLVGLCIG